MSLKNFLVGCLFGLAVLPAIPAHAGCKAKADQFTGKMAVTGSKNLFFKERWDLANAFFESIVVRYTEAGFSADVPFMKLGAGEFGYAEGAIVTFALADGERVELELTKDMRPTPMGSSVLWTVWVASVAPSQEQWAKMAATGITGWMVEVQGQRLANNLKRRSTNKLQRLMACVDDKKAQ